MVALAILIIIISSRANEILNDDDDISTHLVIREPNCEKSGFGRCYHICILLGNLNYLPTMCVLSGALLPPIG